MNYKFICEDRVTVTVDASPGQDTHIKAAGKLKALFYTCRSSPRPFMKVEKYGPPVTYIWAYPSERDTHMGECIASFMPTRPAPWKIDEEMSRKIDQASGPVTSKWTSSVDGALAGGTKRWLKSIGRSSAGTFDC
eukprot:7731502-Pyramimonas_sp.AAC.1